MKKKQSLEINHRIHFMASLKLQKFLDQMFFDEIAKISMFHRVSENISLAYIVFWRNLLNHIKFHVKVESFLFAISISVWNIQS